MGGEDSAGKGKEKCRASCPASVCIFWGLDLAASVHAARRGRPVSKRRNTSVRAMTQALNLRACRSVSNQIAPSKKQPFPADVSLVLHSHGRGRQPGDPPFPRCEAPLPPLEGEVPNEREAEGFVHQ